MAEKRCLSKEILSSDAFLELPLASQALYVQLNLNADDDGLINSTKKIMQIIGAKPKDFNALINKRFVIYFQDDGVTVIKHWWVHNTKRKDRYKPTKYTEIMDQLAVKENGVYTLATINDVYTPATIWQPKDNQMSPKVNESKVKESKRFKEPTLEEITDYCKSRNSNVNPKTFYDYFTAGKWIDSKGQPVKNWKQKIITWEKYGVSKKEEDKLPTYDPTNNKQMSQEEENEILELMKGTK